MFCSDNLCIGRKLGIFTYILSFLSGRQKLSSVVWSERSGAKKYHRQYSTFQIQRQNSLPSFPPMDSCMIQSTIFCSVEMPRQVDFRNHNFSDFYINCQVGTTTWKKHFLDLLNKKNIIKKKFIPGPFVPGLFRIHSFSGTNIKSLANHSTSFSMVRHPFERYRNLWCKKQL